MAIDVNSCGMVATPLNFAGRQHLDPKTSVQSVLELENLRPILPPYSIVIVEDDGSLWQMQPNEEDGWVELDVHGGSAFLDDSNISEGSTYSSSKIDSTYARKDNVYDKITSDGKYGTLAQQESNTTQLSQLDAKVNSLSSAIIYKGNVATYGELLLLENVTAGSLYIVEADESLGYETFPSTKYIYSEDALESTLTQRIAERKAAGVKIDETAERFKQAGYTAQQRFKGLGEMDATQLWETTMNPENRTLIRVNIEDAEKADAIFTKLMGSEAELRKNFIQSRASTVDLDDLDF